MSIPTALTFDSPLLLWALLAVPFAVAAYVVAQRRRTRYAVRFTNLDLLATLVPRTPAWRRHLPAALSLLSLAALLLSLARPHAQIPVPKEQATVIMVMDTSGSMAATDVQPSRIDAARQAGKSFLAVLPASFQVSVVAFSDVVQTLVRPTGDRAAASSAIESLRADGGTAMGDALQRALDLAQTAQAIQAAHASPAAAVSTATRGAPAPPAAVASPTASSAPASPAPAAILLLSDGANTAGRRQPLDAARAAAGAGIPIYTIALGTPDGTLELPGAPTIRGRSPTRRVAVPPDDATLQQIATITGGQFFAAPTASDLRAVYRDIGSRIGVEYERREVSVAFAAAGAVLLVAAGALAVARTYRFP